MDTKLVLIAFIALACFGYRTYGNDVEEDDINTLIKRLEKVFHELDIQDEDKKEIDVSGQDDLELGLLKHLEPTKRWWRRRSLSDTKKKTKPSVRKTNNNISRLTGRK